MKQFKLIALDLDGTLNNDNRVITEKTKDALLKAQKSGTRIVLASGRPSSGFEMEIRELELMKYHGLTISYNGGLVRDVETEQTIYEKTIPNSLAKEFLRFVEDFPVTPIVDDGKFIYTNTPDGFQVQYESSANHLMIKEVDNISDSIDFPPVKILLASPEETLRPNIEKIKNPYRENLNFLLSTPFYLEVTMPGISKSHTLNHICQKYGILREEVIAFGDGENDISMLEFAGTGVAMGNGCEAIKKIADEITLSNNEDGIAHTLLKYL